LTTSMHLRLFQLHLWLLRLHLRLLQLHLRPLWLHLQLLRLHLRLLRLHLRLYFRLFQLYLCTAAFVLSLQRDLPVVSGLECLRVDESAVAFPTDYGMAEWTTCKSVCRRFRIHRRVPNKSPSKPVVFLGITNRWACDFNLPRQFFRLLYLHAGAL
jgi:hypothetical protein